ncbi:MAG: HTTM domain-containing protein [Roseibacillus sp.]
MKILGGNLNFALPLISPGLALELFRRAFGCIFFLQIISEYLKGELITKWFPPTVRLPPDFLTWLPRIPPTIGFIVLSAASLWLAFGRQHRIPALIIAVVWGNLLATDRFVFLNHYYLIFLFASILAFCPKRALGSNAQIETSVVWLYLFRFQVALPYFFGGFNKLHRDWLVRAEPMVDWMKNHEINFFQEAVASVPALPIWISRSGTIFDLLIIPLLLYWRTRFIAFGFALAFHLFNGIFFNLGIFPLLMVASLVLFLPLKGKSDEMEKRNEKRPWKMLFATLSRGGQSFCIVLIVSQILLPLRHWFAPGWVLWNDIAANPSWQLKPKRLTTFKFFKARNPNTGEEWKIDLSEFLTPWQVNRLATPGDYRAFARYYSQAYERKHGQPLEVYVIALRGLNGREPIPLVDPRVDLAVSRPAAQGSWVLPFFESHYPWKVGDPITGVSSSSNGKL